MDDIPQLSFKFLSLRLGSASKYLYHKGVDLKRFVIPPIVFIWQS